MNTDIVLIKKAFEKHLDLITPKISTAYEGVSFTPVVGQPHQRVQLVPQRPDNRTLGDDYYRDQGQFQVFLSYPNGKGTAEILTRAQLIKNHFKRGTTLTEGNQVINIMLTPQISGISPIGDRLILPVLISYSVEAV